MAKTLIGNIKGPKGDRGVDGVQGVQGPAGATGATGPQGLDGDSAYQVAVNNGFVGSEEDWLASLEGGTFVGTITGTIATATDSTDAPIISLKEKGYTEQFTTTGKNLLKRTATTQTKDGVTYTFNEDGSVTLNGTATAWSFVNFNYIDQNTNALPDGDYILSGGTSTVKLTIVKDTKTSEINLGGDTNFSISNTSNNWCRIESTVNETYNNVTVYPMIRLASVTDSTYEPYTGGIASPNPDYPQEIKCIDKISVKTCGKNLFKNTATTQTNKGITFTINNDGSVTANGTATDLAQLWLENNSLNDRLEVGKTYIATGFSNVGVIADGKTTYTTEFVFTEKTERIVPYIQLASGATVNDKIFYPMIRLASIEDDAYQPYTETLAEIDLTEPLYEGDYIEYRADGTGALHRKMEKVVFDGSSDESWILTSNLANTFASSIYSTGTGVVLNKGICSSAIINKNNVSTMVHGEFRVADNTYFKNTNISTLEEWKTWLQSNPVTVVYELATPQEIELTAEQLAQFKNLRTFEPTTNIISNGETTTQYYKANENGEAVGGLQNIADNSVSKSSIANNLTTTTEGMVLDATQGKALDDKISTLNYSLENRLSKSLVSTETINIDSLSLSSGGLSTITSEEISKSGYTLVGAKFFLRGSYAENIIASFTIGGSNTKIYNFVFYNPSDYDISAYGYVDLIYVANSL